jgi:hypothetical protein
MKSQFSSSQAGFNSLYRRRSMVQRVIKLKDRIKKHNAKMVLIDLKAA